MSTGFPGTATGRDEEWFVVLPDDDSAAVAVAALRAGPGPFTPVRRVDHPSRRPWLLGSWNPRDLLIGTAGRTRVAVLGCCPASPAEIAGIARRTTHLLDLDRAARSLTGSSHLIASVDGAVRVQGSAFGVRRVFHARHGDVDVAADRADVLARLLGTGVDERLLVSRLLFPEPPPALAGRPLWHGVTAVAEDHCLVLSPRGRARTVRWWRPPQPVSSLRAGAPALHEALAEAVAARVVARRAVSADLSGGVDSTAVCSLAAGQVDRLPAYSLVGADPADEDAHWAAVAAAGLPAVRRVVVTEEDLPGPYTGILRPGLARDEPHPHVRLRADAVARAQLLTAHGSRLHLTGHGGSEVLHAPWSYLPELLRRDPRAAYAHVRGHQAAHGWSWSRVRRLLTAARDERRVLPALARALTGAGDSRRDVLRLPAWVTPDAVDAVRELLLRAADEVDPGVRAGALEDNVRVVRASGRSMRCTVLAATADGLPVAAPFLDDRVVEACLAVRPHERTTPWRYKPLLAEAMHGLVAERSPSRTARGGTAPGHVALRRYRADLLALCEGSRLAALGLVDVDRLRSELTGARPAGTAPITVERTIGCERWLRDLEPAGHATEMTGAPG
ncbi:asparagine synthase-related protein [Actinosynnema sp. NPDC023587]|uniref:asparagine synthase-related protein n=1 Tax=Actinosynnema sp. NPDC023587 TaxID=3154695 RepID=UPI0033C5E139